MFRCFRRLRTGSKQGKGGGALKDTREAREACRCSACRSAHSRKAKNERRDGVAGGGQPDTRTWESVYQGAVRLLDPALPDFVRAIVSAPLMCNGEHATTLCA